MHRLLAQLIDRTIIRLAARHMSRARAPVGGIVDPMPGNAPVPAFLDRAAAHLPVLRWPRADRFEFTSGVETPWPENNRVHGRFFPVKQGDWRKRPAVILLHGWNDEFGYRYRTPYVASKLASQNLNTASIELPFHLQRRPRSPGAVTDFISEHIPGIVAGSRQAISDTRALIAWLRQEGVPQVGLWGISLGGWIAGLVAASDPGVDALVLMTPIARMGQAIQDLPFCEPVRRGLRSFEFSPMDLVSARPAHPEARILIIEALHDLFVPAETLEELWEAWRRPEIWRLPHGHISILMSPFAMRKTARWLGAQLKAGESDAPK